MKSLRFILLTATLFYANMHANNGNPYYPNNPNYPNNPSQVNNIVPNNGPSKAEIDLLRSQLKAQHETTKLYTNLGIAVGLGILAWGTYRANTATKLRYLIYPTFGFGGAITGIAIMKYYENKIKDKEFEKLEIKK